MMLCTVTTDQMGRATAHTVGLGTPLESRQHPGIAGKPEVVVTTEIGTGASIKHDARSLGALQYPAVAIQPGGTALVQILLQAGLPIHVGSC